MATTKAFELAQLSALTTVDASGNVTTNTSQIANASGDLILDSAADIVLNADGADIILADDTVDFGRFKRDNGHLVIKSDTIDKSVIIKGTTTSNAVVTALTFDMANGGRATFNEQIIAQSNITTNKLNIINASAPYIEFTEGTDVVQMGVDNGSFWIRQNGLGGGDEISISSSGNLQVNHDAGFAGIVNITDTTTSTSSTTGALRVAGGAGITENLNVGGNIIVAGDLTVEGSQVTLNTTALDVEDKNITLNYHASNDTSASADGAGITIQDAVDASNDASILWDATNDEFDVSHSMKIAGSVGVTNIVTNKVVKFNGTILDDSNITDDGTTITASSDFNTSGQMTFTTNAKAIRMRDSNGLYTRSMILNASDVFYVGPVDTYAGGAILYGASADVTDQQFYTGGTLRHVTKSTGDFQWYEDNSGSPQVGMHWDYADGRLGIGTDTPYGKLHVKSGNQALDFDAGVWVSANETDYTVGRGAGITMQNADVYTGGIYGIRQAGGWDGALVFYTHTSTSGNTFDTTFTEKLRITSDGKVGIGTTSPDASLEISNSLNVDAVFTGSISGTTLTVTAVTSGAISVGHRISDASIESNTKIVALGSGTGGIGTYTVNVSQSAVSQTLRSVPSDKNTIRFTDTDTSMAGGTHLGMLEFYSSDSGNAGVKGFIGTTTETAAAAGKLIFGTGTSGAVDATTKMVITSGGDVGIGTESPDCALDVTRTTGWAEMHLDGASGGDLILKDDGVSYGEVYAGNGHGLVVKAYASQDIYFLTNAEATPKMVIESGGNVGIGADPAVHKLDVDGAIATRQVRHNIRPALNLDFANSKQLDSRITFYRDSIATYYDKKGMLKYASENEPRFDHDPYTGESKGLFIEEARTNTKIYSEHLPTTMGTEYGASWVPNYAVAPNGKMQAAALYGDGNTSARAVQSYTGANTYTMSIYAKNNASNNTGRFGVWAYSGGWVYSVTFTWDGDTVTHSAPAGSTRVEKIGNGWVRVYCTWTTSGNGSFQISPGAYANYNSGDSTLFWGMNFEAGKAYSGSYIPSDTRFVSRASEATYYDETGIIRTAPANYPRYSHKYDGRKWVETGLILESAATNLIVDGTSGFSASAGTQIDSTTEIAPDGSETAVQFSTTIPSGNRTFSVPGYIPVSADTVYTYSCYVKNVNMTGWSISFPQNPSTGTITIIRTKNTTISEMSTTEWKRMEITFKTGSSNGAVWVQDFRDGGTGSAILWGKQLEAGDSATSYIYTGAVTTRSADVSTSLPTARKQDIANINDISWYNPDESTIYGEGTSMSGNADAGSNPCLWGITDGTSNNRYLLRRFSNDTTTDPTYAGFTFRLQMDGGFNNDYFPASSVLPDWDDYGIHKMALSIKPNSQLGAADGIDAQMPTISTPEYDSPTMAQIGFAGSSAAWNGHIRKISYYSTQLNIAELKALTENN